MNSDMTIVEIGKDDEELVEICKTYGFEPEQCASALRLDPLGAAGPFPAILRRGTALPNRPHH